jgi:hypothetical protein
MRNRLASPPDVPPCRLLQSIATRATGAGHSFSARPENRDCRQSGGLRFCEFDFNAGAVLRAQYIATADEDAANGFSLKTLIGSFYA